jgi:hypothetical protein
MMTTGFPLIDESVKIKVIGFSMTDRVLQNRLNQIPGYLYQRGLSVFPV